ncbi:DNA-J related domain-containing protein [Neptuniibacter sp. QD72_48]|uniref:DNA-J related domain-containing protein n=1 Tax=Neptuniibacter sp. QD72_48 TaxID=3398214 RepID=UPI0039F584C9
MHRNPLVTPIEDILRQSESSLSEYELLKALDLNADDFGEDAPSGSDLALFRQHFLIMNALYTLQSKFWDQGLTLTISALEIRLIKTEISNQNELSLESDQAVREYYLDWDEFTSSNEESVNKLLDSFWTRYFNQDHYQDALDVLGLTEDTDYQSVKTQYRKLASEHHPDKGGCKVKFNEIREAYEVIISIINKG